MKLLISILMLISVSAIADESPPFTQGQFLSKLQNDEVTMKPSPSIPDPGWLEHTYNATKKVIPSFKREYLAYYHYSQGPFTYTIMWDYKSYRCVFGIDKKNSNPKDPRAWDREWFAKQYPSQKAAEVGDTIKKSFCEKLYGFAL